MIEDFENRNLSLIGHYQNSEEELDGIRKSHQITVNNYDRQLQLLKDHLTVIQTTLDRFVDRAAELELCCKMFSTFEEASNQDDILTQFDSKIKKGKSFIKITGSIPVHKFSQGRKWLLFPSKNSYKQFKCMRRR